ncbi:MAG: SIR2 family NAD-dependent protein deacylase [Hyphomicrobiales bacterium]
MDAGDSSMAIERAVELLRGARRVVVLTGAGISTESGIPDFRGPQGIWTKNPEAEKQATLQHYMANRDVRVASWKNRLRSPMFDAQPNAGHRALAELERLGKLDTLVTQNVDGLHQKGGSSPERVVEVHGTVHDYQCMGCGDRGPIGVVLERVGAGEEDPPCAKCGGILKSATISFGQNLVPEVLARAEEAAATCDLFMAIGTSLGVYPAANLPLIALRARAPLIIINAQETPFDEYAEVVIREPIGAVLPEIVGRL